jgi:putative endonuclease
MASAASALHPAHCSYWVYMLASQPRGTLYVGVTNSIVSRTEQHRAGIGSAFTR